MKRQPPPAKRVKDEDELFHEEVCNHMAQAMIRSLKESGVNLQKPIRALKQHDFFCMADSAAAVCIGDYYERKLNAQSSDKAKKTKNILFGG